jgi:Carboxypeptidase regulatory-like domain
MRGSLFASRGDATDQVGAGAQRSPGRRRAGAPHRTLAVLVGCIALFAVAPVAAAQAASLEGTVTAVKGGATLTGIEVTATSELGGTFGSATTAGGGAYMIAGLSTGGYKVKFHDPADKYIDQEKSIVLAAGTNMLSAALQEPGTISGRVTSASTGSGLGNVSVSVENLERDPLATSRPPNWMATTQSPACHPASTRSASPPTKAAISLRAPRPRSKKEKQRTSASH